MMMAGPIAVTFPIAIDKQLANAVRANRGDGYWCGHNNPHFHAKIGMTTIIPMMMPSSLSFQTRLWSGVIPLPITTAPLQLGAGFRRVRSAGLEKEATARRRRLGPGTSGPRCSFAVRRSHG